MSASFEIIVVPPQARSAAIDAVTKFLTTLGFRITGRQTQEQPGRPIYYPSNRVVFVGPEREGAWIPATGWASELRIDFVTWHQCNPLASALSAAAGTAVYLWTHDDGVAAGYSLFWRGELAESQLVGELQGVGAHPPTSGRTLLGEALGDPGFAYREFMVESKDFEFGTAAIAQGFGLDVQLADVMDLVDGNGGIRLRDGHFEAADIIGWTGLIYEPCGG
jgi:hypothetical protein